MQLQQMVSFQKKEDKDEAISISLRTMDLITQTINEIDSNLIINASNFKDTEKKSQELEMEKLNKFKLDVLFTLHNLYKIAGDYTNALKYAKEHSKLNL